ncbi:crotonobetainyl-CoA:carnitine CoA-transferase CaiB-like acyl-CoA transferase [Sphingomonas jinjuensis]|uniref:Crotonobetainyl-CoA:carnitine CoA-transferase CaiB-like acyl-CoA transferase n=1 Tax=Sphingomonas jinjuensis TaxID=535907 RepID=A0A840F8U4_9SPHN|nr:CaiB/BaiF CoA-transferase family protein [Sphingomonas jinjuensis]MBB4152224.1 crotonobetainyl-CoA:carnitine CoA-transferase CaiB-like acyl-CoA transferase [Sphingomonas jinjuensis]
MSGGRPLEGLLVLDMAQFLAGPMAALKLADLGARVIKIERPGTGDIGRTLYLSDTRIGGDSTLFHAINRNKQSFAADLKDPADLAEVEALIARADVVIQNFRPGIAERLGIGRAALRARHPRLIHASISGYGEEGPLARLPGQDLLAQALSGVMWLNGSAGDGPVPVGLSIADMLAGHALLEGILAALVRRGITGEGAAVETSLLEAIVDFQFEVLTTHLNDDGRPPQRAAVNNAHAYLAAPYGVYATADGHLALAMTPLDKLARLIDLPALAAVTDGFAERDAVKGLIAARLAERTTEQWMAALRAEDVWCAPVQDWPVLMASEAFQRLDMLRTVARDGASLVTTASPIRIDGERGGSAAAAPAVGADTAALRAEFGLDPALSAPPPRPGAFD